MNECEMQIQLRQPPPSPLTSSSTSSSSQPQPAVHRSRLESSSSSESNLQKQKQPYNHGSDSAEQQQQHKKKRNNNNTRHFPPAAAPPVTVAAVQHLLESFDNSILRTAATCVNMSSEQARIAGIPATSSSSSNHVPTASPAAAAALMLLKNRIIPQHSAVARDHQKNGIDLSPRSPRTRPIMEQQQSSKRPNSSSNGSSSSNHIPQNRSPEMGFHRNHNPSHSSPSPTSSCVSSDCNSPPTNGNGGAGGGFNGAAIGTIKSAANGGRLQFFKDGKFILELASSRENDNGRPGWVAVPRKIYWPPTAQGFTTTYNAPSASTTSSSATIPSAATLCTNTNSNHSFQKNESSASLSFSDDNSSIQSSPWQRDHCWKQTTPRRSISRELCFVYARPRTFVELSNRGHAVSLAKRRRPYDGSSVLMCADAFQRKQVLATVLVDSDQKRELEVTEEMSRAREGENEKMRDEDQEDTTMACVEKTESDVGEKSSVDVPVKVERTTTKSEGKDQDITTEDCAKVKNGPTGEQVMKGGDVKMEVVIDEEEVDGSANNKSRPDNAMHEEKEAQKPKEKNRISLESKSHSSEAESNASLNHDSAQNAQSDQMEMLVETAKDEVDSCRVEKSEIKIEPPTAEAEKENLEHSIKVPPSPKIGQRKRRRRRGLESIVSTLMSSRKVAILKFPSPKVDALMHSHMHQHVSPRKRILREFERVTLDETNVAGVAPSPSGSAGKRPRPRGHHHHTNHQSNGTNNKTAMTTSSSSTFFVPSSGIMVAGGPQSNGNTNSKSTTTSNNGHSKESPLSRPLVAPPAPISQPTPPPPKPISSYSIISLLGHNSSGSSGNHHHNNNNHNNSPRSETDSQSHHQHHLTHFASSQQQQQAHHHHHHQQKQHMESVAAAKGMDLQQYNKSLPPKKKFSPPPEMGLSPEHGGGRLTAGSSSSVSSSSNNNSSHTKPHYPGGSSSSSSSSFHPYLNALSRTSPSDDTNPQSASSSSSRYAAPHHHHRSSPQFVRDRHLSGCSPNSRYSPIQQVSHPGNGKNPPAAHGAASPYSTSSRPSPGAAATSPLSSSGNSHYAQSRSRRSPSPQMERRNIDREREAELGAIAQQQHQQALLEFERYSKFYAPHGMMSSGPSAQHFAFEHMSEAAAAAAAAAHLMRPSGAGPGASPAALMSSLHQAAYLMYPPMAGGTGPGAGNPYLTGAPSSSSYYQQYMTAAAAAAMYGRGNPLWSYMAAGGIPGPPGSSLGISGANRMPQGLHHSPQMSMHHGMSPVANRGDEGRSASGFSEPAERMSPGSPLALRIRDSREREVGMEQTRDDSDLPLNLSKH